MKRLIFLTLTALLVTFGAAAQTVTTGKSKFVPEDETIDNALVEQPAAYPGGDAALLMDVARNIRYPAIAVENGVEGVVFVRFKVDENGKIGKVAVQRSLSKECDREAVRVISKLKKFIPAQQQGRPVAVLYTLPIRFRMQ